MLCLLKNAVEMPFACFFGPAMFSEAWRDELRELAAKVGPPSQAQGGEIEVRK